MHRLKRPCRVMPMSWKFALIGAATGFPTVIPALVIVLSMRRGSGALNLLTMLVLVLRMP